ncbi:P22 phage major capsid protein family protein, partial [Propionibacterium freudenreichii]|uniref:P22 phage major capsid protein family protein n=1 Tax=Propionibacterium freudenreichii TaxID=1744 RepID=UPI00385402E4
ANAAVITFLNTATRPINAFWAQGAVTLDYGRLSFPSDQGPKVLTSNTKNGVPLIMSYAFDHLTGVSSVRCHTLYATTVLEPEHCG